MKKQAPKKRTRPSQHSQKPQHKSHKKPFIFGIVSLLFSAALFLPLVVFAAAPTFTEYYSEYPDIPDWVIKGPDGNMWFTTRENNIGKINPTTGVMTKYPLPEPDSWPTRPLLGPDGNIWFAEGFKNRVGKITPGGAITEYALDINDFLGADDMVIGPDGNIWFASSNTFSKYCIGVMDTNGTILHKYVPNNTENNTVPGAPHRFGRTVNGLSVGADGYIWFAEQVNLKVGKVNPADGVFTEYDIPDPGIPDFSVYGTVRGPDDNIWFYSSWGKAIGRFNPSTGTTKLYTGISNKPSGVTVGPDGNIWFGIENKGLGMLVPSTGVITEYTSPSPPPGGGAMRPTTGLDSKIWYVVSASSSKIGKADIGLTSPLWTPPPMPPMPPATPVGAITSSTQSSSPAVVSKPVPNPSPTPLPPDKLVVVGNPDGTTKATLAAGIALDSRNYIVPDKQILYVDGSLGTVEVKSGASIRGTGKVAGLTVQKGAFLAPGHSPGCITSGNLKLSGTYQVEINGIEACKWYDQTKVTGSVTLDGALDVSVGNDFLPEPGQKFVIVDNDGQDVVQGTFNGLPEGSVVTSQGASFTISYKSGDGNDVVLTVVSADKTALATSNPKADGTKASFSRTVANRMPYLVLMYVASILGVAALGVAFVRWRVFKKAFKK